MNLTYLSETFAIEFFQCAQYSCQGIVFRFVILNPVESITETTCIYVKMKD